ARTGTVVHESVRLAVRCWLETETAREWFRGPRQALGSAGLHVQLFVAQVGVDAGDEVGVTIVELGRDQAARADVALHLLAPARVRHAGIDVGPEAVFVGREVFPERLRPLGRE